MVKSFNIGLKFMKEDGTFKLEIKEGTRERVVMEIVNKCPGYKIGLGIDRKRI